MMAARDAFRRTSFPWIFFALALLPAAGWAAPCSPAAQVLCLGEGSRFQAEVSWTVPGLGSGVGRAAPLTGDTGLFWFFDSSNLELVVKVLDGRPVNGHFWVFYGSLSNVAYTLTVTDTQTGVREVYQNPAGRFASAADTSAFDAEASAAGLVASALREGPWAAAPAAASAAPAPPLRQGPEVQINQTTQDMQRSPDVAMAPDGGFLVVWEGAPQPSEGGTGYAAYGRLYDAQGRPRGNEFRLSPSTAPYQWKARVAASPAGEYMAVWMTDAGRMAGRVFGPDGQPLTGEIDFPSSTMKYLPDVAADPAGGFLVVWTQSADLSSPAPVAIRGQRFDSRGNRVGGEIAVSSIPGPPRVVASPAGGFLVAWTAPATPASSSADTDVWALRLDASGQPLGVPARMYPELSRRPGYIGGVTPVAHADGSFSVLWGLIPRYDSPGDEYGLFARRFAGVSAAGEPILIQRTRNLAWEPAAAALLPSGETWVIWSQWDQALDADGGLEAALFDKSWNRLGSVSPVNSYTADAQIEPAAAAGPGGIVAVWSSGVDYPAILPPAGYGEGTQDGSFFGVFGQRFKSSACALDGTQLCLGGRFRAEARFKSPWTGKLEPARAMPLTSDTGAFWFFQESNVELMIKVLDGRSVNGHFWVYFGALSDVEYTVTVTDTQTGATKTYRNPARRFASVADSTAF